MIAPPQVIIFVPKDRSEIIEFFLKLQLEGKIATWDFFVTNASQQDSGVSVTVKFTGAPKEKV